MSMTDGGKTMNIKKKKPIEQPKTRWLCLNVKHKCGLMQETVSRTKFIFASTD